MYVGRFGPCFVHFHIVSSDPIRALELCKPQSFCLEARPDTTTSIAATSSFETAPSTAATSSTSLSFAATVGTSSSPSSGNVLEAGAFRFVKGIQSHKHNKRDGKAMKHKKI